MEQFDPLHRWLGIPPEDQPANFYRLLGINVFESDPEVIRDAAERQMGHVRRYGQGKHLEVSQTVLNALGSAKACLLNSTQKAAYDAQLREVVAAKASRKAAASAADAPHAAWARPASELIRRLMTALREAHVAIPGGDLGLLFLLLGMIGLILLGFREGGGAAVARRPSALRLGPLENQSLQVGRRLSVGLRLTDAATWKDRVRFEFFEPAPEGAKIDPVTGEINWTPKVPGAFWLAIRVSCVDDSKQRDETRLGVEVRPETPRLVAIGDKSVVEGQELRFTVAVGNVTRTGKPLLYRLGGEPPRGAQIDPHTGVFTWTPGPDPGPGFWRICVGVVTPERLADEVSFRVEVRGVNRAPKLQDPGKLQVAAGGQQQLQITAIDPDGAANRLIYKLLEAPPWVTVEADSGTLICQPPVAAGGTSHRLRVRVTDDAAQALSDEMTLGLFVEKAADVTDAPRAEATDSPMAPDAASSATASATQVRLMLSGNRAIELAQWDLTELALARVEQLYQNREGMSASMFAQLQAGPNSPIVAFCGFAWGREVRLEGDVIGLHEGVDPSNTGVNPSFKLKRYSSLVNGRWQGRVGTWDPQRRKVFYGEYDKGKRQGYCCLFRDGAPRLVLECMAGNIRSVHLIDGNRVEKTFQSEREARADAEVLGLLDEITKIEGELHRHDESLKSALRKRGRSVDR